MAVLSDAQREAGWTIAKLGDIAPLTYGKSLVASKRIPGDVPVYSSAGLIDSHNESIIDGQNIIIGRKGTIGSITWSEGPAYPIDTTFYTAGTEKVNIKYLYYLLKTYKFSEMNTDSAVPGLKRVTFESQEAVLPPLEEQERIAGILGSLDDKIEANTRLIQTMDSYKSTLFQAHICSESEGETIKVSDVATLIRENIAASDIDESMNYVALEHIPRHSLYSHEWTNSEGVMSNKSGFKVGDILFGKLRPYFHKVSIAAVDGIASTDILVLRPKPGFEVLAQSVLSSEDLIEYATQVSSGTRMPRASWKDIMNYEVTVKNVEILQESLSGFDAYSRALIHENKVLTETRDTLIKRLIG